MFVGCAPELRGDGAWDQLGDQLWERAPELQAPRGPGMGAPQVTGAKPTRHGAAGDVKSRPTGRSKSAKIDAAKERLGPGAGWFAHNQLTPPVHFFLVVVVFVVEVSVSG